MDLMCCCPSTALSSSMSCWDWETLQTILQLHVWMCHSGITELPLHSVWAAGAALCYMYQSGRIRRGICLWQPFLFPFFPKWTDWYPCSLSDLVLQLFPKVQQYKYTCSDVIILPMRYPLMPTSIEPVWQWCWEHIAPIRRSGHTEKEPQSFQPWWQLKVDIQ